MDRGTTFSAAGHVGVILWVALGDWLFAAKPAEEVLVSQVSLMTEAEFQAMQASAPAPSETPPAVETPVPVQPDAPPPEPAPAPAEPPPAEPQPQPQPAPEPLPEPQPQPDVVPEPPPDVAVAQEDQPLPSLATSPRPRPKPADRVAPAPVEVPDDAQTAETPEPAVSEVPVPDPVVVQEPTEATVAEETGDVLKTEATPEQDQALGMTASPRPRTRPERPVEVATDTAAEDAQAAADARAAEAAAEEQAAQAAADAVAAAVAEAASQDTAAVSDAPVGPPLNSSEIGDLKSAIGNKWNIGAASSDALRTTVVIRVEFNPDGKPGSITLIESDGPTDAATKIAFDAARRAVQRAYIEGGIPLPPDKYDTWKVLELVFDPNGMRLR